MATPKLNKDISVSDFYKYYWLKSELIEFCKKEGLIHTGNKEVLSLRIKNYLLTRNREKSTRNFKNLKKIAVFDWKKEKVTRESIISADYKNTENV